MKLRSFLPFLLPLAAATAQASTMGPFSADSFESHRYTLGTLPGQGFADGQDGWLLLDLIGGLANLSAAKVQTAVVKSGSQAVEWDAALMTPGTFGELRRNATFPLVTGVMEIEYDFMITTSTNPSSWWEFYTQALPHPASCQMRWFIGADGHVEYFTGSNHALVVTNYIVARDVWHHARTVVDIFGDTTEIHIDGTLVGTGQPIGVNFNAPAHGFTEINVDGAGNDKFYLDNFTVRERTVSHGLSVDLQRLPVNLRSVMEFELAGGASLANRPYILLGTISGVFPGTFLGSQHVPLNYDGFCGVLIAAAPVLPGFLAQFNADGNAHATFDTQIQVPSWLLGLTMDFAYVTLSPIDASSESVSVQVTQ